MSSSAFLVLRDIAVQLNLKCLDTCLKKTYKAYIAQCLSVESANPKHVQFLSNSVVELYSLDLQKAYHRALVSVQQLANILQQALKAKKVSGSKLLSILIIIIIESLSYLIVVCLFSHTYSRLIVFL